MSIIEDEIKQDIKEVVRGLLERNDSWGVLSKEITAILMPDVKTCRTLLTPEEKEDLIEYLQILESTSDVFDYPERIVCTINTIAIDSRGKGIRRRKGFLSDFEESVFEELSKVFLVEAMVQDHDDRIDEIYKMRHTVI